MQGWTRANRIRKNKDRWTPAELVEARAELFGDRPDRSSQVHVIPGPGRGPGLSGSPASVVRPSRTTIRTDRPMDRPVGSSGRATPPVAMPRASSCRRSAS